MTVVSNTTPLNYLILIRRAELLTKLFGLVVIPEAVFNELSAPSTPSSVSDWIANKPAWLTVQSAPPDSAIELEEIQIGEQQAIGLAQTIGADYVLLDDRRARKVAKARGVKVVGTLGVLLNAADKGLTDLAEALQELQNTNFRASPHLIASLLNREDENLAG